MRLSVDSLRRVVKRDLAIEFVPQRLTSYGGLELLRRYVQRLDLAARLRRDHLRKAHRLKEIARQLEERATRLWPL